MKICVAYPDKDQYSATFIRDHINRLDNNVIELYGSTYPFLMKNENESYRIYNKWIVLFDKFLSHVFKYSIYYFRNKKLAKVLIKNKVSVILAEYGTVGAYITEAAKKANIPLVVHVHGYDIWRNDIIKNFHDLYKKMFMYANFVIAGTKDMMQQLQSLGCPIDKIIYLHCGVDTNIFKNGKPERSKPYFLSVGRFVEKKAPYLTILSFYKVLQEIPNAKLYMAGDGPLISFCKDIVRSLRIDKSIIFIGIKTPEEISDIYKKIRGFIQHSIKAANGDSEGTAISVLEASASGVPVIATRHAGIKKSVVHKKTGYLVVERDIDSMAMYIIKLCKEPKLAQLLGRNGRKRMIAEYQMAPYINGIKAILEKSIMSKINILSYSKK